MRSNEGWNSCPDQGSSRVKFPHSWYQEPEVSPNWDVTLTTGLLGPFDRLVLWRKHVVQVGMNPTNHCRPPRPSNMTECTSSVWQDVLMFCSLQYSVWYFTFEDCRVFLFFRHNNEWLCGRNHSRSKGDCSEIRTLVVYFWFYQLSTPRLLFLDVQTPELQPDIFCKWVFLITHLRHVRTQSTDQSINQVYWSKQ